MTQKWWIANYSYLHVYLPVLSERLDMMNIIDNSVQVLFVIYINIKFILDNDGKPNL